MYSPAHFSVSSLFSNCKEEDAHTYIHSAYSNALCSHMLIDCRETIGDALYCLKAQSRHALTNPKLILKEN